MNNSTFNTRVNLDPTTRQSLVQLLNTALGTSVDLRTQIKQAHWNIKGAQFVARHELFDDLADHAATWTDDIAERAVTLGGYAHGTSRLSAERSRLPEYNLRAVDGATHVKALADQFGRYAAFMREGVHETQRLQDPGTEDLLTEILRDAEKDMWFLEAHLQG